MEQTIPIDWQKIHTVFLDMDGTLLDLHFDNHFWLEHMPKRYAEKNGIYHEEANSFLQQHSESTSGTLDWYCLDYWSTFLDMDVVELKHEVADKIAIRKNVVQFLHQLNAMDKQVVLLTNAHSKSVNLKFSYVDIGSYFDEIITSHNVGLAKEEDGFWEALHEHTNYDKEHSLFIDDNLDVLDNAQRYGIKHLLTIAQPDSQKPNKNTENYMAIQDYQQLIV